MKHTVMTITGIRPDFIRMSKIFEKLDTNFNHVMVHTGQHQDYLMSEIFFRGLQIREPNIKLNIAVGDHAAQLSNLAANLPAILKNVDPELVIFLGDSNSVLGSIIAKKMGYKVAHIEAGMRSFDMRMLEEVNRKMCDHCSDLLFCYHDDYAEYLTTKEGIGVEMSDAQVYVVGNTIVEVALPIIRKLVKNSEYGTYILVDIHRPENFLYPERLKAIVKTIESYCTILDIPARMIHFDRTATALRINKIPLPDCISIRSGTSYAEFMEWQYNSRFIVSDSGTAQEEPALFGRKVLVPRVFTERPQSMKYDCSKLFNPFHSVELEGGSLGWATNDNIVPDSDWLGKGNTSDRVVDIIREYLQ